MKRRGTILLLFALLLVTLAPALAQSELAATLEVLAPGVEVLRVNTANWVTVNVEAIVGVGDRIRTNAEGRARITFFADGVDTELLPETEYVIEQFEGSDSTFDLSVAVITGQTLQRIERVLDSNSSYNVNTPGMELAARGTAFAIRVEDNGRSAMLVSDGEVAAEAEATAAEVPLGFGIRAAVGEILSDVVLASTFEQLDSGLDGCSAALTTTDDVQLNVRLGPDISFARVGNIPASDINRFFGAVGTSGWYRIQFRGGFAWILSSTATVESECPGLRQFPADHGPEDPTLFSSLGDNITLDGLTGATADVEATPEATETPES